MASWRRRPEMVHEEQTAFLREAGEWRRRCVAVLARAPIQGPIYVAASGIMDAIDRLAQAVTGRRDHFHLRSPRTPGPDLDPLPRRDPDGGA